METIPLPKSVLSYHLRGNDTFPNNEKLPVILYKGAWDLPLLGAGEFVTARFAQHQWENAWKADIFEYHHYHSTAHEVLAAIHGNAQVQLGGERGEIIDFEKGDVLVIPAGVAHRKLSSASLLFECVGAYPIGQFYNMRYGNLDERPISDEEIKHVPLPTQDPLIGNNGPLVEQWGIVT